MREKLKQRARSRLETAPSKSKSASEKEKELDELEILQTLMDLFEDYDNILVGAGAGLSAAAKDFYTTDEFAKNFQDFIEAYHFTDPYSAGFYPFESLQEYWALWSRMVQAIRYQDRPLDLFEAILSLLKDKNYFVLTTNVDHFFQKAGFDKERLFYTQGDMGLFQCSRGCHAKTYDNETIIQEMVRRQKGRKIPEPLIPACPICHAPMDMNLRKDESFVEDAGWHQARERYLAYLDSIRDKKILVVELGVGFNSPGVIKYPFWNLVEENPQAFFVSINQNEPYYPRSIADRSLILQADIAEVIFGMQTLKELEKEKSEEKKES